MLQLRPASLAPEAAPAEIAPQIASKAAERARALCEQQLQTLTRLAEIGLELAAETARRAQAEVLAADARAADFGLVYARIARAVRMTLALQSRVMKDLLALDEAETQAGAAAAEARAGAQRDRAQARKDRVDNIVRRVIEAQHDDDETVERLTSDVWERLSDDDVYGDLSDWPIGEIVVRICEDLGLSPDWSAWAKEAWAADATLPKPHAASP
jgi:hypothetical protein